MQGLPFPFLGNGLELTRVLIYINRNKPIVGKIMRAPYRVSNSCNNPKNEKKKITSVNQWIRSSNY